MIKKWTRKISSYSVNLLRKIIINISICMYSLLGFGACVRTYQWDGVSWLLHLYHCGLGGILAGKGKERCACVGGIVVSVRERGQGPRMTVAGDECVCVCLCGVCV